MYKSLFYTLGAHFSINVAFGKYASFSIVVNSVSRNWGGYLLSFSIKIEGTTCAIVKAIIGIQRIQDATSL